MSVSHASFQWESSAPLVSSSEKKSKVKDPPPDIEQGEPSSLHDIDLHVPRGELWIVCGAIGSGKSSLLQGLIGEMRRTEGEVTFGRSSPFFPAPWGDDLTLVMQAEPFRTRRRRPGYKTLQSGTTL